MHGKWISAPRWRQPADELYRLVALLADRRVERTIAGVSMLELFRTVTGNCVPKSRVAIALVPTVRLAAIEGGPIVHPRQSRRWKRRRPQGAASAAVDADVSGHCDRDCEGRGEGHCHAEVTVPQYDRTDYRANQDCEDGTDPAIP